MPVGVVALLADAAVRHRAAVHALVPFVITSFRGQ